MSTISAVLMSIVLLAGAVVAGWWVAPDLPMLVGQDPSSIDDELFVPTPTGSISPDPDLTSQEPTTTTELATTSEEASPAVSIGQSSKDATELASQDFRFSDRILNEPENEEALRNDHLRRLDLGELYNALHAYYTDNGSFPVGLLDLLSEEYLSDSQFSTDPVTQETYEYQSRDGGQVFILCAEYETESKTCYRDESKLTTGE